MTELFLGIIALTLVIAFWNKINPVLLYCYKNMVRKPLEFIFSFIYVWLSEWKFTGTMLYLAIKQAWKKHKFLFILVIAWLIYWMFFVDYGLANAPDWMKENHLGISRYDTYAFIVKYVLGLFGLIGSIFSVLADFEFEKKQYEIKEENISKIFGNDNLFLVVFYDVGMFVYLLYYLFGLKFVVDIYTALFVPFVVIGILMIIKNKITKNK